VESRSPETAGRMGMRAADLWTSLTWLMAGFASLGETSLGQHETLK
jgi:hypothetical protein